MALKYGCVISPGWRPDRALRVAFEWPRLDGTTQSRGAQWFSMAREASGAKVIIGWRPLRLAKAVKGRGEGGTRLAEGVPGLAGDECPSR